MEKLQEILNTMSSLNINIDSDVFAYYRYKVSIIDAIFSFLGYLAIGAFIGLAIYGCFRLNKWVEND